MFLSLGMDAEEIEKSADGGSISVFDYLPKTSTDILLAQARLSTVIANQNKILAILTGKSVQDIEEESDEIFRQKVKENKIEFYKWFATKAK